MPDYTEALRWVLIGFAGILLFFLGVNTLILVIKRALLPAKKSKSRAKALPKKNSQPRWSGRQSDVASRPTCRPPKTNSPIQDNSFGFTAHTPPIAPPVIANAPPKKYQYKAAGALLTRNEQAVLAILQPLIPAGTTLVTKVRLIDLVAPAHDNDYAARNTIWNKHVDFVLIDTASSHPIMAIEVQDRSHNRRDRQRSDEIKREAFSQAGIHLLELWHTQSHQEMAVSFRQALIETRKSA